MVNLCHNNFINRLLIQDKIPKEIISSEADSTAIEVETQNFLSKNIISPCDHSEPELFYTFSPVKGQMEAIEQF